MHPTLGSDGPAVSRLGLGRLSPTCSSPRPRLRDNLAALDPHRTAIDLGGIDAAVPGTGARGARYGSHGIAPVDR